MEGRLVPTGWTCALPNCFLPQRHDAFDTDEEPSEENTIPPPLICPDFLVASHKVEVSLRSWMSLKSMKLASLM